MIKSSWLNMIDEIMEAYPDHSEILSTLKYLKKLLNAAAKTTPEGSMSVDAEKSNRRGGKFLLPCEILHPWQVAVFTDGACRGNPGPGAWACFAQNHLGEVIFEATSFDANTTNNRMELTSVIHGLTLLRDRIIENTLSSQLPKTEVYLYSDSKYAVEGVHAWSPKWKKNGWKKSDQKVPENLKLWQELDVLVHDEVFKKVQLIWVKGHDGHPQNEYCDQLCQETLNQVLAR